jgi:hypothetical protein
MLELLRLWNLEMDFDAFCIERRSQGQNVVVWI